MGDMVQLEALRSMAPKFKGKSANLSPLMLKLQQAQNSGDRTGLCPFGCTDEDHDSTHYCHHVVGTTVPFKDSARGENRKVMEPMGWDKHGNRITSGQRVKVPEGCRLERITSCSRVYDPKAEKPAFLRDDESLEDETPDEIAERELADEQESLTPARKRVKV